MAPVWMDRNVIVMASANRVLETGASGGGQIEGRGRAHWPARAFLPAVGARGIGQHRRRVRVRRALEIMVEERLHPARPPFERRVAGERQRAEVVAVMVGARMPPWADDEVQQLRALIFSLERLVDRRRAIAVLLVPLTDLEHRRHGQRPRRQPLVDRLA